MIDAPRPLTLERIGELAGVSRSTVSRVLNDHPHVASDVRARVEAVIAETGYLPNQAARALVSNRSGVVALVMPTLVDELFGDPYFSALVEGIQDGSAEHGSVLSIFPIDGDRDQTQVLAALVGRGFVDGVIVTAGPRSHGVIAALRDRRKRLVVVGDPECAGVLRVDVDNRSGSVAATNHLLGLGRRRVGFVGPPDAWAFAVERRAGHREAHVAAGIPVDEALIGIGEPTVDGGHHAASAVLAAEPDALHVATDTMAIGALRAIAEAGLSVPGDIAVVGFDGLPGAPHTTPALTTVVQPVVEVGRVAADLLHGQRETTDPVILPTVLRAASTA